MAVITNADATSSISSATTANVIDATAVIVLIQLIAVELD